MSMLLSQDFPISVSIIWNQWKMGKMSDDDCDKDLVRCRDRTAPSALAALDMIRKRTKMLDLEEDVANVQRSLEAGRRGFRQHAKIDEFMMQFQASTYGVESRFRCLVLVGGTQQGKTSKGMSLWGSTRTLKVSCGNCGPGVLPSLAKFERSHHKAILFDEVRTDQVLSNRELFQSNEHVQTLGQSACNPFAYSIWVYHIAMILCANSFDIGDKELTEGDRDWLQGNMIVVELPKKEKWYHEDEEIDSRE